MIFLDNKHSQSDIIIKSINSSENNDKVQKENSNNIQKYSNVNCSLSNISNEKTLEIIPLKTIKNLFINYDIIKIDKNGLNNNIKQGQFNKVIFNIYQENNSPQNCNFLTSDNSDNNNINIDKNGKNENIIINNNNKIDTVFINNKIDPKINKSISLFFIQYNNISNSYILKSLTDEVFFAMEISCNNNFYLEDSKRYYIQINETIISLLPNNSEKNIKIKILNSNNNENKNKYSFEYNKLPVKIGRINCNININKNYISKIHLIINFDKNINQFYIRDNNSTNGSLILLKKGKDIKLEDKMFFFLVKEDFILKR